MPVHNEAAHLPETLRALLAALSGSGFEAEVVLVDDGSTDPSADVVRQVVGGEVALRVVSQANKGRFEARRAGLEAARGDWVLLLDARVRLHRTALAYVRAQLSPAERVWNGHVHVDTRGNPYGAFWNVLAEVAWREYFDHPRRTSFDGDTFDHYPKGTGCFLAPRELLLEAVAAFRSYYADGRFVSDDTGLIRWLADRERIQISPDFSCLYAPRTNLRAFLRQAVYRGSTFLDGHGRPESRFFPVAAAFFPVSAALGIMAVRRPGVIPVLAAGSALAAGVVAASARRSRFEIVSFGLLTPPYALGHGLGMWRGLLTILGEKRAAQRTATGHPPRPRADAAPR